jgi:hypothetical protein
MTVFLLVIAMQAVEAVVAKAVQLQRAEESSSDRDGHWPTYRDRFEVVFAHRNKDESNIHNNTMHPRVKTTTIAAPPPLTLLLLPTDSHPPHCPTTIFSKRKMMPNRVMVGVSDQPPNGGMEYLYSHSLAC